MAQATFDTTRRRDFLALTAAVATTVIGCKASVCRRSASFRSNLRGSGSSWQAIHFIGLHSKIAIQRADLLPLGNECLERRLREFAL
jgi:hypothetical protein